MRKALLLPVAALVACGGPPPAEPVLPHDTFQLDSRCVGEARRINVWVPPAYATSTVAYPVLYMPDGGVAEDFPHITTTIATAIAAGELAPMLVVGIENTQRRRDLTSPTSVASDREVAPVVGGAPAFRAFLATELIPEIERRYRCAGARALVGESLAGLFVLDTLCEMPDLFERWIAFSPSLWWNAGELVQRAAQRLPKLAGRPRTVWFASADETDIIPHAERLAEVLRQGAPAEMNWQYAPLPDLQHSTIFRGASPRVLRQVLWR